MLTPQDLAILKKPFLVNQHEFRNGFVYIREQAICDRIEMVDPSWSISEPVLTVRDTTVTAVVTMTIKGVSRSGVGMDKINSANEAEKSAATDALKRVARLFGAGRYLLNPPAYVKDHKSLARWLATLNEDGESTDDSEQPEAEPAPAPLVDRGNLPIVESPFKSVKKSEPQLEDHLEPTDFATQTTEAFSDPIEKVTIKTTNKGKSYFVIAGCSIWDTGIFEKLGYDEYTLNQMTKPGSVILPDPVRVAYIPEGKDRKYPEALRVFRPINQAKVVLKEQNAA